jgi:uncharacterized protein YdhG (YjbR/CyaY superfamily)
MSPPSAGPTDIDAYLLPLVPDQREALQRLRETLLALAPGATECISYRLPALRQHGKLLMGFGAAAHHCALYPMSGTLIAAHQAELADYSTSKGTIRFQPQAPLPDDLVRRLVAARIREMAG